MKDLMNYIPRNKINMIRDFTKTESGYSVELKSGLKINDNDGYTKTIVTGKTINEVIANLNRTDIALRFPKFDTWEDVLVEY